ncbi:hypothetical protein ACWEV4_22940 [Streptomyces sp. NPDC003860]
MPVSMPPSYTVFCLDRTTVYQRYAEIRVGCSRLGAQLVRETFGDLAMLWVEALQSPSPAAMSWALLAARITAHGHRPRDCVHDLLPRAQADALVLRYKVGLTAAHAATVMGIATSEITVLQMAAVRAMANPSGNSLRHMREA